MKALACFALLAVVIGGCTYRSETVVQRVWNVLWVLRAMRMPMLPPPPSENRNAPFSVYP